MSHPPLSLDDEADYTAPRWLLMAPDPQSCSVGLGLDWIGVMGIVEERIGDFVFFVLLGQPIKMQIHFYS